MSDSIEDMSNPWALGSGARRGRTENCTFHPVLTSISSARRIFPMNAALMHHGLERAADRYRDRDAVRAGDDRWSFREIDGLSNAFAQHLTARGVGAGDRVAVM